MEQLKLMNWGLWLGWRKSCLHACMFQMCGHPRLKQIMLTTTNLGGPYICSQCVIIKDATMIFTREAWTTNADNKLKTISREYKERWVVNSVILNIRIIYLFVCFWTNANTHCKKEGLGFTLCIRILTSYTTVHTLQFPWSLGNSRIHTCGFLVWKSRQPYH